MKAKPERTIETFWEHEHFTPTEEQPKAIRHVDGPLYLTAGTGSAKTCVLLWRTLNLIAFQNTLPEEILLSTFTEKAALLFREGLRGLLSIATPLRGKTARRMGDPGPFGAVRTTCLAATISSRSTGRLYSILVKASEG